jgi:hypothetical protein
MSASFDPSADWPVALAIAPSDLAVQEARRGASEKVTRALPAASRQYSVDAWLRAAPAEQLFVALVRCAVAVDHWNARVACPTAPTRRLKRYLEDRAAAAVGFVASGLARWATLERIPIRWISEEPVRAAIADQIRRLGLEMEVTELQLVPPVLGGSEWVKRDSASGIADLSKRATTDAVAAILHWTDRTLPAVVIGEADGLRAFGAGLAEGGSAFLASELVGADVLAGAAPPIPWRYRLARWLGLGTVVWNWVRRRRLQRPRGSSYAN